VFAGTVPSPAELDDYYAGYPVARPLTELTVQRYDELLQLLEGRRQTGRLLDIGCGDGDFLVAAREHGWSVYGSEFGDAPLRRAKARSLDVRPAPFEATPDELGSFDVVTLIEVVEHVVAPRDELQRIAGLLRDGGCLYLTTPNFNSISRWIAGPQWRAIEYPEHLNLFTPRTLHRMLAAVGLSLVSVRTTGASPSELLASIKPARSRTDRAQSRPAPTIDERMRASAASSPRLDHAISAINAVLTWTGSGDTIKALYIR
jgi:SAM-dependent methyltransferase